MGLLRRPFADVVELQLRLFREEHGDLLARCRTLLEDVRAAERDNSEERFGDFADAVDEVRELLEEMADAYAATLDERMEDTYRVRFERTVRRRFPELRADG